MKKLIAVALLLGLSSNLYAGIKLPKSMRLAGPLDSAQSAFGDEFFNFPAIYGGRAKPGRTTLSGWIEFAFTNVAGNKADFTVKYNGVGSEDSIEFPGGQTYTLQRNRAFNNDLLESKGTLDLDTGKVEIEIHAIFLNTIIARVDKTNRIPFGFPNDYPPTDLPVPLPFSDRPSTDFNAKFVSDADGNITGFEFTGQSTAPVTVFPRLGLFPPFSFGQDGLFYFANPTGCLAGAPPANCPTDQTNPDGILLSNNAFFHPHYELITSELREVPQTVPVPPALPIATASPAGLVAAGGRLYQIAGFDRSGPSARVQLYDPVTNQWGSAAPIPTVVTAAQSAAVGSHVYVVGGWSAADGAPTNLTQVFDAVTNRWTRQQPAPAAVFGGVAASVGSRIYVIGGWTGGPGAGPVLSTQVQVFDTVSGSWSFGARAPLATAGSSVATIGSDVYVINGITEGGVVTNRISIYSTATDSWRAGPNTKRGVYEASAGYVNNRIYLAGGRLAQGGPCDMDRIQILEVPRGLWRDGHEQPIPTAASGAAVLEGKFYVVGGRTMVGGDPYPGDVNDVVQRYDPEFGWIICNSRPFFTSATVMNVASGFVGPPDLAPGTRALILGYNFAESTETAPDVSVNGGVYTTDLPPQLNGISVSVDGKAAPIFSVSPTKVEFQIPYEVAASSRNRQVVSLALVKEGSPLQAPPIMIPILAAAPGIYVYNFGEYREPIFMTGASAVARNSNGKLNHPSQPAHRGETIALQVTGLGLVDPALKSGQRAWDDVPAEAIYPPKVTIGGKSAKVVSIAVMSREAGLYEIKTVIPADCPLTNNVSIVVTSNLVESNRASISVR